MEIQYKLQDGWMSHPTLLVSCQVGLCHSVLPPQPRPAGKEGRLGGSEEYLWGLGGNTLRACYESLDITLEVVVGTAFLVG
jgi:hypothetical protein